MRTFFVLLLSASFANFCISAYMHGNTLAAAADFVAFCWFVAYVQQHRATKAARAETDLINAMLRSNYEFTQEMRRDLKNLRKERDL